MVFGAFDAYLLPFPVMLFLVAALGLCLGSFTTAVIYRAPRNISWIGRFGGRDTETGGSHCPSCGHGLGIADLVPFFSWLVSRGRCRYCAARVPLIYPATEISVAMIVVLLFCLYGMTLSAWPLYFAAPLFFSAGVIGATRDKLPLDIVYTLSGLSALYLLLFWNFQDRDMRVIGYAVLSMVLVATLITGGLHIRKKRRGVPSDRGWLLFSVPAGVFTLGGDFPAFLLLALVIYFPAFIFALKTGKSKGFWLGTSLCAALPVYHFLTGLGFD